MSVSGLLKKPKHISHNLLLEHMLSVSNLVLSYESFTVTAEGV